jgi:hypothetical protein
LIAPGSDRFAGRVMPSEPHCMSAVEKMLTKAVNFFATSQMKNPP